MQCFSKDEAACAKYLFLKSWKEVEREAYLTNLNEQDWKYWTERYLDEINTPEDAYVAIQTMLSSLDDPYTRFLTPDELENQNLNITSQFSGIGVVITSKDGKITVEDVIENSPALKADLKVGDILLKVDGVSVSGFELDKVADKIRGERGTNVQLVIMRGNDTISKAVIRDNVKIKAVSHKMLADDIAYVKISTFMSQTTAAEFVNALQSTKEANSMIIDLRGNQGGLLQNATFIANILLRDGDIVKILQKNGNSQTLKVEPAGFHIDKPLVVLTNGMCASAGEILAAALQENDRAKLVGETTYGKGLIQRIMPLPMDTAMNVTIAKYLTPDGHDIHKNGIKPDYEVKLTVDDVLKGNDLQLNKAVELLVE